VEARYGRVVVADGDETALAHSAAVLRRGGYDTIAVTTGGEALDAVAASTVRLAVLELRLPDMTGYEVCHEIRRMRGDELAVFFLTDLRTEAIDRVAGLLIGADDFIVKPFEPDELIARVRRVFGRTSSAQRADRVHDWPEGVTPRELEVLDLLAAGRRPKEIAAELTISQKTVATHIQHLLEKVGVHSRAELIARAYLHGMVTGEGRVRV
jgi:DNA-binding NarL/FixJ family response regulator